MLPLLLALWTVGIHLNTPPPCVVLLLRPPLHAAVPTTVPCCQGVPLQPSPDALLHWEVARIYAETVTLPELRPDEDPEAARLGGMFHLYAAAAKGLALAQLQLAW